MSSKRPWPCFLNAPIIPIGPSTKHLHAALESPTSTTSSLGTYSWCPYATSPQAPSLDVLAWSLCAILFNLIHTTSVAQFVHFSIPNTTSTIVSFPSVRLTPLIILPSYHYCMSLPSLLSPPLKVNQDYFLDPMKLQWISPPKYVYQFFFTSVFPYFILSMSHARNLAKSPLG